MNVLKGCNGNQFNFESTLAINRFRAPPPLHPKSPLLLNGPAFLFWNIQVLLLNWAPKQIKQGIMILVNHNYLECIELDQRSEVVPIPFTHVSPLSSQVSAVLEM